MKRSLWMEVGVVACMCAVFIAILLLFTQITTGQSVNAQTRPAAAAAGTHRAAQDGPKKDPECPTGPNGEEYVLEDVVGETDKKGTTKVEQKCVLKELATGPEGMTDMYIEGAGMVEVCKGGKEPVGSGHDCTEDGCTGGGPIEPNTPTSNFTGTPPLTCDEFGENCIQSISSPIKSQDIFSDGHIANELEQALEEQRISGMSFEEKLQEIKNTAEKATGEFYNNTNDPMVAGAAREAMEAQRMFGAGDGSDVASLDPLTAQHVEEASKFKSQPRSYYDDLIKGYTPKTTFGTEADNFIKNRSNPSVRTNTERKVHTLFGGNGVQNYNEEDRGYAGIFHPRTGEEHIIDSSSGEVIMRMSAADGYNPEFTTRTPTLVFDDGSEVVLSSMDSGRETALAMWSGGDTNKWSVLEKIWLQGATEETYKPNSLYNSFFDDGSYVREVGGGRRW